LRILECGLRIGGDNWQLFTDVIVYQFLEIQNLKSKIDAGSITPFAFEMLKSFLKP